MELRAGRLPALIARPSPLRCFMPGSNQWPLSRETRVGGYGSRICKPKYYLQPVLGIEPRVVAEVSGRLAFQIIGKLWANRSQRSGVHPFRAR